MKKQSVLKGTGLIEISHVIFLKLAEKQNGHTHTPF
jgi:hypothetical protein